MAKTNYDIDAEDRAEIISTVRESIDRGEDVRVTLESGKEFIATPDVLQDHRVLAEDVTRPRTKPPHGMIRAIFGVDPDDLPSNQEGYPYYIIVESYEVSAGGWGTVSAAWLVQDGTVVGGPEESIEESETIKSIEVVIDE